MMNDIQNISRDTIKIYNPKSTPYGPLSNNYVQYLKIDDSIWSTVTNYVLANMLITPLYRNAIQASTTQGVPKKTNIEDKVKQIITNREVEQKRPLSAEEKEKIRTMVNQEIIMEKMNIYQKYNYYLNLERIEMMSKSLRDAYSAKVMENKELQKALASTGDAEIIYESKNADLGITPEGKGLNLLGKALMQVRHVAKVEIEKLEKDAERKELEIQVFTAYTAQTLLEKELLKPADIRVYHGLSALEIIAQYKKNYPRATIDMSDKNKANIIEMYNKGLLPLVKKEIEKPGTLSQLVYNKNLNQYRMKMISIHHKTIVEMYTEYVIQKKYPQMEEVQVKEAAKQLAISAPNKEAYSDLATAITSQYYRGNFPVDLVQNINLVLSKYPIPGYGEKQQEDEVKEEVKENSSSEEEVNELKKILKSDDEKEKTKLIKKLSELSGNAERKYRKLTLDELRKKIKKYGIDEEEEEEEKYWKVTIKHRTGRKEVFNIVGDFDKLKFVQDYNSKNLKQITTGQVLAIEMSGKPEENIEKQESTEIEEWKGKEIEEWKGKDIAPAPVQIQPETEKKIFKIYSNIEKNEGIFQQFAPRFRNIFTINGDTYPSVSIYLTAKLLTMVGKNGDLKRKGVFRRGMGISSARALLRQSDGSFMSQEEADSVFARVDRESTVELMTTFVTIALDKKFENMDMQDILLLTGNAYIAYTDPYDSILGTGKSGNGKNITGQILQAIREKIVKKRSGMTLPPLSSSQITSFLTDDLFMNNWVRVKVREMCNAVFSAYQYTIGKSPNPVKLTRDFAEIVLDNVLQSCSSLTSLSKKVEAQVPKSFVDDVYACKGMAKLSKNYTAEIEKIRQTMIETEDVYMGTKGRDTQKDREFEEMLRVEWANKVTELQKGIDIGEEVVKFDEEVKKRYKNLSKEDPLYKKMKDKFIAKVYKPQLTEEERRLAMEELAFAQEKKRQEHYKVQRSREEKEKFEKDMKLYAEQIIELEKSRRDEISDIENNVQEIAQLYWERIAVMIYFLFDYMDDATKQDMKNVISNIQLMSFKRVKCSGEITLSNEQDNCIASALCNILIGLQTLKNRLNLPLLLTKEDINFATSIILDRSYRLVESKVVVEEIKEKEEEIKEYLESPQYIAEEEPVSPISEEEIEYIAEEEEEEELLEPNDDIEYEDVSFGMRRNAPAKNEQVKIALKQIAGDNVTNIDVISTHFMKAVKDIRTDGMPKDIKTNRINFFATIA